MRRKRLEQMEQKNKVIASIGTPSTIKKFSSNSIHKDQEDNSIYGSGDITEHSSASLFSFTPSNPSPIRVKQENQANKHSIDGNYSYQEEQLRRRHQYSGSQMHPNQHINQEDDNPVYDDQEDVHDPKPSTSGNSGVSINTVFFILLLIVALVLICICVYSVAIVCLS